VPFVVERAGFLPQSLWVEVPPVEEPERFSDLPRGVQVQLATGGPLLLGVIAGLTVVHGATAYWIIQFLAELIIITTVAGALLGALGGVLGDRTRRRDAGVRA
jgi:hypothetical protein